MRNIVPFLLIFSMLLVSAPYAFAVTDTAGPEVSAIAPLEAVHTVPQLFYATASDPGGVAGCSIMVSSVRETMEPMTYNETLNRWEGYWTFTDDRTANSIRAVCTDVFGNETLGSPRVLSVSAVPQDPFPGGEPEVVTGDPVTIDATEWTSDAIVESSPVLIKTVCPGGEDFTHPCRTVYFLDNVGTRHAFTNERAYFTWYTDWNNIHLITESMMASYPLGPNVRYHPGVRMVKFPSVRVVYAVAQYGKLREIASETIAIELYGENWNQLIDDISEAFSSNYSYGDIIDEVSDFDVNVESARVDSINDNLSTY